MLATVIILASVLGVYFGGGFGAMLWLARKGGREMSLGEMTSHDVTIDRYRQLHRMTKWELASRHIRNGGLLSMREYMAWSKEDLIKEVMFDEASTQAERREIANRNR